MKTAFLFCLLSLSALASQAQDTLFYKNFNDLDLYNDPRAYLNASPVFLRIVSIPNSTQYVDGSPAMMADIGNIIGQDLFGPAALPNTPSRPFYTVQLKATPLQDTVLVTCDLRAKTEFFSSGSSLSLAILPKFSILYFYANSATKQSFSRGYDIRCLFPVSLEFGGYAPYFSIQKNTLEPDLVKISMKYPKDQSSFQNWYLRVGYAMSRVFDVTFPSGSKTLPEAEIKKTLLVDFCASTDNPSECLTNANLHIPPPLLGDVEYNRNILVDNITILGKNKKVITDLEEEHLLSKAQEIQHAYTLMGTEINDYAHYSGLAIVERKDGSRSKVMKH